MSAPLHLYLHFPLIAKNRPTEKQKTYLTSPELTESYLQALEREIEMASPDFPEARVVSLHLGLSPLTLTDTQLAALLNNVRTCFSLAPDCEIGLDAYPEQLTSQRMVTLGRLGIARICLQLFSCRTQDYDRYALPGSLMTAQTALILPQMFHMPGYAGRITYGLPEQTPEQFLVSTRFLCRFHTPEILFDPFDLENVEAEGVTEKARSHLMEKGYREYLKNHFVLGIAPMRTECARSGDAGDDFLAFGPGTVSRTEGITYRTVNSLPEYLCHASDPESLYTVVK